ncbi:MAG: hypothetical protein BroJett040_21080 [Oligoflexia bacterium]|nr:MAG: hypothetical protein BroJett040_21080 [Oligoflexia bacterium]
MSSATHVKLGKLIREYREKKGLTQFEVAQMLGHSSSQFMSLMERGLSKIPFETLGKFVVILGIPESKVMGLLMSDYEEKLRAKFVDGKTKVVGK